MHAEEVNVVAAFLDDQNLVADFVEFVSHVPVEERAQLAPTKKIVYATIKAARYYDDVGSEFLNHGKKELVTGVAIFIVPELAESILFSIDLVDDLTRLPGNIDIEVFSLAFANVFRKHLFAVWVEREIVAAVHRDEQYLIVVVECLLGAIAMVDVPIKNANSIALILGVLSSYCDVVEDAKASGVATF